ncbi:MAG: PEP-CTERM sorting domain-containing protein [Gemmatimonadaceae bacterium]
MLVRTATMRGTLITALLALATSTAGAQAQAQFFVIPSSAGPPSAPYSGTSFCTVNLGAAGGYSVNFNDPTSQNTLAGMCPGTMASDFQHNFAIKFTGVFNAATTGIYSGTFNSDDGTILTVNGSQVFNNYVTQGGGPGLVPITLQAGANPFQLDYFENNFGGANVSVSLGQGLTWSPPSVTTTTTPEPSSMALLGTGLISLVPMVRRRRNKK